MPVHSFPLVPPDSPLEALAAFFASQASLGPEDVVIEAIASSEFTDDPCWQWRVTESAPKLVDLGGRVFVEKESGRFEEDTGGIPLTSGVIVDTSSGWIVSAAMGDESNEDQIEMILGGMDY